MGDCYDFPSDVYPVGRLDRDSEGLLLLTNDKKLNHRLLNPAFQHPRTYLAQVEGIPKLIDLNQLSKGVVISVNKKKHQTLPAEILQITDEPVLPDRYPPIRFRKNTPTTWLQLTLIEGKNRQVRKMCAKIGFPVLRLVRVRIGNLTMETMESGKVVELKRHELYQALQLD